MAHTLAAGTAPSHWRNRLALGSTGGVMRSLRLSLAGAAIAMDLVLLGVMPALAQRASEASPTTLEECPPGTDANVPGPADQVRPGKEQSIDALVFDPQAGRILATVEGMRTWAFDVCTNTWSRIEGARMPVDPKRHDADSSLRTALGDDDRSWPSRLFVYDPGADRYVAYVGDHCYGSSAAGLPDDCAGDRTWLGEPETWTWSEARAITPEVVYGYGASGQEITYDEATGRAVIFGDGLVIAYDVAADAWEVLHDEPPFAPPDPWPVGPLARLGHAIVYDALNQRVVVMGGQIRTASDPMWVPADDAWAFDTRTRRWTELLAPSVPHPTPVGEAASGQDASLPPSEAPTEGSIQVTIGRAGAAGTQVLAILFPEGYSANVGRGSLMVDVTSDPFTVTDTIKEGSPWLDPRPMGERPAAMVPPGTYDLYLWTGTDIRPYSVWVPAAPVDAVCLAKVAVAPGVRSEVALTVPPGAWSRFVGHPLPRCLPYDPLAFRMGAEASGVEEPDGTAEGADPGVVVLRVHGRLRAAHGAAT